MSANQSQEIATQPIDYSLLLLRVVALLLLAFSATYWAKLVGISNEDIRFDTLPTAWKIAATSLVVLQPVAALGLWAGWRWGVVIWLLIAFIECTMYGLYADIFGRADFVILFHAAAILLFLIMTVIMLRTGKPKIDYD